MLYKFKGLQRACHDFLSSVFVSMGIAIVTEE